MRIWHYTIYDVLEAIFKSGEIKTTNIGVEAKEKPAAWFSINSDFEQTAKKAIQDPQTGKIKRNQGRDELFKAGFQCVRIEVNQNLPFLTWKKYKNKSGISKQMAKAMEQVGIEQGANPDEWLALFKPVSLDDCLNIEIWDGKEWVILAKREEQQEG
jgi:hypothetical protein